MVYLLLQLSHYLDIIEVQIARQVALKSEAFFHVMSTHKELQSRLASSTSAIVSLRSKVSFKAHYYYKPAPFLHKKWL